MELGDTTLVSGRGQSGKADVQIPHSYVRLSSLTIRLERRPHSSRSNQLDSGSRRNDGGWLAWNNLSTRARILKNLCD